MDCPFHEAVALVCGEADTVDAGGHSSCAVSLRDGTNYDYLPAVVYSPGSFSDESQLFAPDQSEWQDNVTDWCLEQFQDRYGQQVSKDDIWEYLYGVMHAPDWRERFRHDLQRSLPRLPLAPDFEAFRSAGRELMDLHIGYESCPEMPLACLVDGKADDGQHEADAYRIHGRMQWGRTPGSIKRDDKTLLHVNERCQLVDIPPDCHEYTVSGRSPLEWAVTTLALKHDKPSGITDDPNRWHVWADKPFNLIRHLRRLAYLGARSAEIIAVLPPSLDPTDEANEAEAVAQ